MEKVTEAYSVYSIIAINIEWRDRIIRNLLNRNDIGESLLFHVDPRYPLFIRVVAPFSEKLPLEGLDLYWEDNDQQMYDYLRILHGIPEGSIELPHNKQKILALHDFHQMLQFHHKLEYHHPLLPKKYLHFLLRDFGGLLG